MKPSIKKITIIGVGMIGGSIALGLRRVLSSQITICGLNSNCPSTRRALDMGLIDKELDSLTEIPKDTDIVILATPIEVTKSLIPKLAQLHLPKTLFIDVGSIKVQIANIVQACNNPSFDYISTHPMAGSEQKGFACADPFLFANKPWIISMIHPVPKNKSVLLDELITLVGAKKLVMRSSMHDKVVTWGSHIPLMISSILVQRAFHQRQKSAIEKTSSTGFRDTTRLASHDANFKTEIALNNSENILKGMEQLREEMDIFTAMVRGRKTKLLKHYFTEAKQKRDHWLAKQFA